MYIQTEDRNIKVLIKRYTLKNSISRTVVGNGTVDLFKVIPLTLIYVTPLNASFRPDVFKCLAATFNLEKL